MFHISSMWPLLLLLPGLAHSQYTNGEVCNAALAKDIGTTIKTQQQDLDFISIVDEKSFSEAKQSGSFGVSIPIADDLLNLSTQWKQFQQNRKAYFSKVGYESHTKSTDFQHFEITSPVAYEAWTMCVLAFSRQQDGLFVWKEREDANNIVVRAVFHSKGKLLPVRFKVRVARDSENVQEFPTPYKLLYNEQVATFVIPRSSGAGHGTAENVTATFDAGRDSGYIFSRWVKPTPPPVITVSTQAIETPCMVWRGNMTNDAKNLIGAYCSAPPKITGVKYLKCVNTTASDDVCGHTRFTEHANIVPGAHQVNSQFSTDNGNPNALLYFTVFSTVEVVNCTGEACKKFKFPSEVLRECPNQICAVE